MGKNSLICHTAYKHATHLFLSQNLPSQSEKEKSLSNVTSHFFHFFCEFVVAKNLVGGGRASTNGQRFELVEF